MHRYKRADPIGVWGGRQANGTWTGMIGDIGRGEAFSVATSMALLAERTEVLDYPMITRKDRLCKHGTLKSSPK